MSERSNTSSALSLRDDARRRADLEDLVHEASDALTRRLRGAVLNELAQRLAALDPYPEAHATRTKAERQFALIEAVPQLMESLDVDERLDQTRLAGLRAWTDRLKDEPSKRRAIAEYLSEHVKDARALRGDLQAVERHLDVDVIAERTARASERRAALVEFSVVFSLRALRTLHDATLIPQLTRLAQADGSHANALRMAMQSARWQTTRAAIEAAIGLATLRAKLGLEPVWIEALWEGLHTRLLDPEEHFAVAMAAVAGLPMATSTQRGEALDRVLAADSNVHFLVRRRAVDLLRNIPKAEALAVVARLVTTPDRSEHVRMGVAELMAHLGEPSGATFSKAREPSARVRAVALRTALAATATSATPLARFDEVIAAVEDEDDSLVVEVALESCAALIETLARDDAERLEWLAAPIERLIDTVRAHTELPPPAHETLAATAERLHALRALDGRVLQASLRRAMDETRPGKNTRLALARFSPQERHILEDPMRLARLLAELSRDNFGLSARVRRGVLELYRGDHFVPRAWRFLHEVRHRAPNKRQAFSHIVGRIHRGNVRAHPTGLDEVTATTVPGERVTIDREGGWGRHLPSVDDLLDLPLWRADPVFVASSHGVTRLDPPTAFSGRLQARLRLTTSYARFAALRLASLRGVEPSERRAYVEAIERELGIRISFLTHSDSLAETEPSPKHAIPKHVASVLSASRSVVMTAFALESTVRDFVSDNLPYFTSPNHNSQPALALFSGSLLGSMLVRSYLARRRIERARAAIPLSIGGWGTRGKSGTERIKAGLFHGLGYQVLVKTTGCEAMFIHSVPGQRPLEVFIYRPYDKATIWEQAKLVELAALLKAEVFLWECMALNPRYVEVLAHDWMRDDLTTLTNAFPDHEDIQGPAGHDVAAVISRFIPKKGTCFTSEVNFLPLFEERARQLGTKLIAIHRREADLMPDDVLALFPYQEHPRNIALVARLAEHFEIDRWTAIALMAEHVVPDLGVLKTYPDVVLRGRRLRFMNGMSANERTGCVSNWRRMKLDELDVDRAPHESVITVVNNRDDRVARSEVFGRILVEDLVADRHVLIGTNLGGLMGYIENALGVFVQQIEVLEIGTQGSSPKERLRRWMARLRIPSPSPEHMLERLELYARGAQHGLREEARQGLHTHIASLLKSTASQATSIAHIRDELAKDAHLKALLDTALSPSNHPCFEGDPEILEAPPVGTAHEYFLYHLGRVIAHARLIAKLPESPSPSTISSYHETLRAAYRELFMECVHPISDPKTSGDQIIDVCAQMVAPGTRLTVMGIQNIKGTGLDFAYRWVALGSLGDGLAGLRSSNAAKRARALSELEAFGDHGLVDSGLGRLRLLEIASTLPSVAERERARALAQRLDRIFEKRKAGLVRSKQSGSFIARILHNIERTADYLDAITRARAARQVLSDLVHERISIARASLVLRQLTARQKGGWLLPQWRG